MKTEHIALAVRHRSSTVNYCSNGCHHDNAKHRKEDYYQLHPEKRSMRFKKRNEPKTYLASASSATTSSNCCSCLHPKALSCSAVEGTASIMLESACTDHMLLDFEAFSDDDEERLIVTLADNSTIESMGRGTLIGSSQNSIVTFDTFYVPKI
ncbi:hypothetical protein CROQUDRAFT_679885 [Cronartium quercuum f. sp. fusiforme G11]|uniref:Uncharacterized protein n=1 Tax=Cronartium quercuum f. sp. fusiforme G11 TaxID=708437 RepID=A0A9P6NCI9_9BASI|nr:hypothetical protein CROQUDRAFT_679885 [Cronartium quercuum f. sp. fusiforme G11]